MGNCITGALHVTSRQPYPGGGSLLSPSGCLLLVGSGKCFVQSFPASIVTVLSLRNILPGGDVLIPRKRLQGKSALGLGVNASESLPKSKGV